MKTETGASYIKGTRVVWGIPKELPPIEGLPEGRIELRFGGWEHAVAIVTNRFGQKSQFFLEVKDGKWIAHPGKTSDDKWKP